MSATSASTGPVAVSAGPDLNAPATLPGLLAAQAASKPDSIAFREKKFGIWQSITWLDYLHNVIAAAGALEEAGVKKGEPVIIYGENSREWFFADQAVPSLGAASIGIHPHTFEEELASILEHAGASLAICGRQEQVDRLLELPGNTGIKKIIVLDPRGVHSYNDPRLVFWEDFIGEELQRVKDNPSQAAAGFQSRIASLDPSDDAMVLYSTGRLDFPRGAWFSHETLINTAREMGRLYNLSNSDTNLCYLPLCYYLERILSAVSPLVSGNVPGIIESEDTVMDDLRELSPTVFYSWPRFYLRTMLGTKLRMSNASLIREFFFDLFVDFCVDTFKFKKKQGLWFRFVRLLGDKLFFRPLMNRLGLRNCRLALVAGGEILDRTLYWFQGIGIPVREAYGLVETAGTGFTNTVADNQPGAAGKAFEGVKFRFAKDGELLLKASYLTGKYFGEQNLSSKIDEKGWFHTGDFAFENAQDRVVITGSRDNVCRNTDGESFSIQRSEDAMREIGYIREIVCIAEDKPYVTALVEPDYERVADEILIKGARLRTFEDVVAQEEVYELIKREIEIRNEDLIEVEKVKDFRFFPHELDEETGELSFDQSPRRHLIERRYKHLIEPMYADKQKPAGEV